MKSAVNNRISFVFNIIFTVFLVYVLLSKLAYLFDVLPGKASVAACAVFGVIAIIIYTRYKALQKLCRGLINRFVAPLSYRRLFIILFAVSLLSKLVLTFILKITSIASHSDIQVYVEVAQQLVCDGSVHKFADYCYTYSHMFWFAVFLMPTVRLFGSSQLALSCYLAIVSTVSLLLVFDLTAYMRNKDTAFVISHILCLLPSQLLVNQFITHEIALQFFLLLAFWLYFRILPRCKHILSSVSVHAAFMLSMLSACLVNSAGLVMLIAFVLFFFAEAAGEISSKAISGTVLKIAVLIAVITLGSRAADSFQLSRSFLSDEYVKGDKFLWTLYVGANAQSGAHWSFGDTETFNSLSAGSSPDELRDYRIGIIKERYLELFSSPSELLSLIKTKSVSIWSCFSYPIGFANETIDNDGLQLLYHRLYRPLIMLEYALSFTAAVWCLMSVFKTPPHCPCDIGCFTAGLFLMGMTAMLLLTECNNKYTLAMQPFFWYVCFARHTEE